MKPMTSAARLKLVVIANAATPKPHIFFPCSTLVPTRRTTSGLDSPTLLMAATTPEAITSQLFRGENLTMLLRHALTPSARNPSPKILMICCVAACRRWRRMTIDSLRFATECTQITLKSAAEQAVDRAQISEVQRLLRSVDAAQAALRAHLAVAQRALRGSGGAAAEERLTRWAEDAAALVARTRRVAEACDGKGDA